jgi:NAD(P)H-quinone oxidoreductase subunit 5
VSAWVLMTVVAVLVTGALLLHLAPAIGLGPWRDRLYVAALSAGQQRTYTDAWGHPPRLVPTPRPRPVPQLEGARA